MVLLLFSLTSHCLSRCCGCSAKDRNAIPEELESCFSECVARKFVGRCSAQSPMRPLSLVGCYATEAGFEGEGGANVLLP